MRSLSWPFAVIVLGLLVAGAGVLVTSGHLPQAAALIAVIGVPIVVLFVALAGMMATGRVAAASIVVCTAIAAPLLDLTLAATRAGDFDAASGYGLVTGIAIAVSGALWLALAGRRTPVHRSTT